jgi:hypothetical protein
LAVTATVLGSDTNFYSDRNQVTFQPSADTLVVAYLQGTSGDPTSVTSSHGTWELIGSGQASFYGHSVYALISGSTPPNAQLTALYSSSGAKSAYIVEYPNAVNTSVADAIPVSNRVTQSGDFGSAPTTLTLTLNAFGSSGNGTSIFGIPSIGSNRLTSEAGYTDLSSGGEYSSVFHLETEDTSPSVTSTEEFFPSHAIAFEIVEDAGGSGTTIEPDSVNISISGEAVVVQGNADVDPSLGSFSISGNGVNVSVGFTSEPEADTLPIQGQLTSAVTDALPFATAASLSINGQSVDLDSGRLILPASGSLSVSGQDVSLGFTLVPQTGNLLIVGQDVVLTEQGQVEINPDNVQLAITGQDLGSLVVATDIDIPNGNLSISGGGVTLDRTVTIIPGTATLSINGQNVTVDAVFAVDSSQSGVTTAIVTGIVSDIVNITGGQ